LLPRYIIAKHFGHATVASWEPQKEHCGASVVVAAPHIGQLIVPASIARILAEIVFKKCFGEMGLVPGALCFVCPKDLLSTGDQRRLN
jgi:hypothetical protein